MAKVIYAMQSQDIYQLSQLSKIKGIGIKTLEKIFNFAQGSLNKHSFAEKQQTLI